MSVQGDKQAGSERPVPDEDAKAKAATTMQAYEDDRPTLVLPGSGKTITGTAVGDWLDEDGNPKYGDGEGPGDQSFADKIAADKAYNEEVIKALEDDRAATK
jgi:hypothetical protein